MNDTQHGRSSCRALKAGAFLGAIVLAVAATTTAASDYDVLKVQREGVFAFAEKPAVTRNGDRVTISFETKSFCDVTVAIEETGSGSASSAEKGTGTSASLRSRSPFPRIVRHLVSGVLGPNAPAPLAKNTKRQTIVWDGKNDQGVYIDDKDRLTVRVSLGLKARFERDLNWSPYRRVGGMPPIMWPTKEGVYVYDGRGVDHLRLFDHDGAYLRTIYPFERSKLEEVKGLTWRDFPQGDHLPWKQGSYQQTFLTAADRTGRMGFGGWSANAMAIGADGRIALVHQCLNRLHTDGTTGGRDLLGPIDVTFPYRTYGTNADGKHRRVAPTSAAFSPDGKWVYLTGFAWRITWHFEMLHGVIRIPYEMDGKWDLFAGSMKQDDAGKDNAHFNGAASVAVDRAGRVYVSDLVNNRVQVFSPEGKHLKTIAVYRPAQVAIHPKTQDVWVFSWPVYMRAIRGSKIVPTLTRFGPFENPEKRAAYPLPLPAYRGRHNAWWDRPPLVYRGGLDGYTDPPTVWVAGGVERGPLPWMQFNIQVLRPKDGRLRLVRSFGREAARASGRQRYAPFNYQMQRLAVNPKTGNLFLMEPDSGPANKAYKQLVEFNPENGRPRTVDLPFNAEDLCFDHDGFIYLRSTDVVVRYDSATWREKPWDYGRDLPSVTCGMYGRSAPAVAGLVMLSKSPVCFHQGGMAVSPKGHLAVSCAYRWSLKPQRSKETIPQYAEAFKPRTYPGMVMSSTSACVHIWDERGKLIHKDAVEGMPQIDGLGIDADDQLYVMATPTRILDGKPYFNKASETVMRLTPGASRFVSSSARAAVRVAKGAEPDRPKDVTSGQFGAGWVEGARWMYPGVGFAGFNDPGCACWHCRFALDTFARSFAPEMDQYRVAVLDKNGNLIMRIGQYGNADDGEPLVPGTVPLVGTGDRHLATARSQSPVPRSIGGDEVGLFYGAFLATHTDHRLFIADIGNQRIVQVKLGYHANERVPLKDINDAGS